MRKMERWYTMKGTGSSRDWKKTASDNSALIAFVVLFLLAVALKGTMFLSWNNIINILRNNSIIGISLWA